MNPTPELLLAFGIGLLLGGLSVFLLQRRLTSTDRERADQLASELEETREELDEHREEVTQHFRQTSQIFRTLTEQYTRLYGHLAEGAREFCTGDVPPLGRGLEVPLLGSDGDEADAEPQGGPTREAISAAVAAAAAAARAGDAPATAAEPAKTDDAKTGDGRAAGAPDPRPEPEAARDPSATLARSAEPTLAQPRPTQANGGSPLSPA